MTPVTTFFAWVLSAFVIGMLFSGREHGASLLIFGGYIAAGIVGGIIHGIIVHKKEKTKNHQGL